MVNENKLYAWFLAARPRTLTAAFVPIWIASCFVYNTEPQAFQLRLSLLALFASFGIQVGTNLVNDAVDFKKGTDNKDRLGPSRVTQQGVFSYGTVMIAAFVCFLFALTLGIPLVVKGGLPIMLIGIISIIMGYAYTGGPFPLAYRGLGDLFVILFFGIIAVMGLCFLHLQAWSIPGFVLGLQVGLWAASLIAINNLRDIDNDTAFGKRTLAVRLGLERTRYLIALYLALPFLIGLFWIKTPFIWSFILPLLALPLAIRIINSVWQIEPSAAYNKFLGLSAALHLVAGVLLGIGFFI